MEAESAQRRASVARTESESERLAPATPIRSVPGVSVRRMSAMSPINVRTGLFAATPCACANPGAWSAARATISVRVDVLAFAGDNADEMVRVTNSV